MKKTASMPPALSNSFRAFLAEAPLESIRCFVIVHGQVRRLVAFVRLQAREWMGDALTRAHYDSSTEEIVVELQPDKSRVNDALNKLDGHPSQIALTRKQVDGFHKMAAGTPESVKKGYASRISDAEAEIARLETELMAAKAYLEKAPSAKVWRIPLNEAC